MTDAQPIDTTLRDLEHRLARSEADVDLDWTKEPGGDRIERAVYWTLMGHRLPNVTVDLVDQFLRMPPPAAGKFSPIISFSLGDLWATTLIRRVQEITGWELTLGFYDDCAAMTEHAIAGVPGEGDPGWVAILYSKDDPEWECAFGYDATRPALALCRAILHTRKGVNWPGRPDEDTESNAEPPPPSPLDRALDETEKVATDLSSARPDEAADVAQAAAERLRKALAPIRWRHK